MHAGLLQFTLLMHKGDLVTLNWGIHHINKLETDTQLILSRVHLGLSAELPAHNLTPYKSDFLLLKEKCNVKQLIQELIQGEESSHSKPFDGYPKGIFAITKIKHPFQHNAKDALVPVDFWRSSKRESGVILDLRRDKVNHGNLFLKC